MASPLLSARLAEVDEYIANARPFAQPTLLHLRETVHRVVPEVDEAMKWSMPFFVYRGVLLANMAAFKEHASFGLWGREVVANLREAGVVSGGNMGSFGRLTAVADLPPTPQLEDYIRRAATLISEGKRTRSIQRVAKPARAEAAIPEALAKALATHPAAAKNFVALSPSCRREYADWIATAKRDDTRVRRIAMALASIAEGKSRFGERARPA